MLRLALLSSVCIALHAGESAYAVSNPTGQAWQRTAIRMPSPLPAAWAPARGGAAIGLVASRDGEPRPCAMVEEDGAWWAVVLDDLAAGTAASYRVAPGGGVPAPPQVHLGRERDGLIIDNGRIAVRVPSVAAPGDCPGPLAGIRQAGTWVGSSRWLRTPPCTRFACTVIADGTVTAAVRMRWDFQANAGIAGDVPAFAEVTVRLDPGADHLEIQERHTMPAGAAWECRLAEGWSPDRGTSTPFGQGPGSGDAARPPAPNRPLAPVDSPSMRSDLFLSLLPRWNQHFKDGWSAGISDGTRALWAVAVSASRWVWPHDNEVELVIDGGGTLRMACERGRRVWWLMSSAAAGGPDAAYLARWCWQHPSRVGAFDAAFPGAAGGWRGTDPFDGASINPTGPQRSLGRQTLKDAGKAGDLTTSLHLQDWLHPDVYGSYWLGWSPENPNFFTDFTKPAVGWTAQLRGHPHFAAFTAAIEARLQEDMFHSVALPGGAGQECPGYLGHSIAGWSDMAAVCRLHLGFDPATWERYRAAVSFRLHVSQPDGTIRRDLPIGDTHPDAKAGGPAVVAVEAAEVARWSSEELPGFGVILRDHPGGKDETYVSFKAGPNRGHYHGDQLSLHWCSSATPLAVDHHCSYHPRAGQEHMHNRVSFATAELPYANLDGYERLLGFATGISADIAVGEVASTRLRACAALPPEVWHQEYPQQDLGGELRYRRCLILMKGGAHAYLVVRDQWWAPREVRAAFNLHVLADPATIAPRRVAWKGRLTLVSVQAAESSAEPFAWSHANGGQETTNGVRLIQSAATGEFLTVLWPGDDPPALRYAAGKLSVGDDQVVFSADGGIEASGTVLAGTAVGYERDQGDIGLFVPDAGYPFGRMPDWLIRQRWRLPPSAPAWAARLRDERP